MTALRWTMPVKYLLDLTFWCEAALVPPIVSPGAETMGFTSENTPAQLLAFAERKNPQTGEPFGQRSAETMKKLHGFIYSAPPEVSALLTTMHPDEMLRVVREAFVPAVREAMRVAAMAVQGRMKVGGKRVTVKAEPISIAYVHLLARRVDNRPPELSVHAHEVSDQPVVMPDGSVRSEANPMSRRWVRKKALEAFHRTLAVKLNECGYRASYDGRVCRVPEMRPEYVQAVTGARGEAITEWLKDKGYPDTPKMRQVAAYATRGPRPIYDSPAEVLETLQRIYRRSLDLRYENRQKDPTAPPLMDQAALYAARRPHLAREVMAMAKTSVGRRTRQGYYVKDAAAFLDRTRTLTRREQVKLAWKRTRKENLDWDWAGVQALGRILARFTAHLADLATRRVGPAPGTRVVVPEGEWQQLKADGQLPKLYVRAERQGWHLEMLGMSPPAHERRVKRAQKAIKHKVHKRQDHQGYEPTN